ncbi:MAG TPA: hypothetical protein VKI44_09615, partial [Acetobacteraceae bacterium]|nr:hypothetical protein [Acetobacteraceae bacterium]
HRLGQAVRCLSTLVHGVALLCGFDTPSLPAQGGQRRQESFNRDRDIPSPAPESGNVLLVPLAGHEIGHSAWRRHQVERSLVVDLLGAVHDAIEANTARRDDLLQNAFGRTVRVDYLQQKLLGLALRHVEEIFCDLVGFYIFGEAYLWAFEYFLAPGNGDRNLNYPADHARTRYLQLAAKEPRVKVDPIVFDSWRNATYPPGHLGDFLRIVDEAVETAVPDLWLKTRNLLGKLGVRTADARVVKRAFDNFSKGVPDGVGASLSEVIEAGWKYARAKRELLDVDDPNFEGLNELMLKSIEVSEYLLKVQTEC